jgi:pimeloyl-ACP methyl ester carboxylesterase
VGLADEGTKTQAEADNEHFQSTDIEFQAHDGVEMFGKLVLPVAKAPRAILIYVQSAEGSTVDQKRPLGGGKTFNYFDLYRVELTARDIGFFSYEGRGIRMGDNPPRYEQIDREVYDTSTLDNKVRDVLSAIDIVRSHEGLRNTPILLMGASEGTLIAVEAASRKPDLIQGLVLYGVLAANMRENFRFIMTGGSFLPYASVDKDQNGSITKDEWEAVVKNADFSKADQNGDEVFTASDFEIINQKYVNAIDNEDFQVLNDWGKASAGVVLPSDWFKDHFAHAEMWEFLEGLKMPVGLFHGDRDNMASMEALKVLEAKATSANHTNLEFRYFEGLDHTLNIGEYFVKNKMPKGHQAIFQFIDRIAPKQ